MYYPCNVSYTLCYLGIPIDESVLFSEIDLIQENRRIQKVCLNSHSKDSIAFCPLKGRVHFIELNDWARHLKSSQLFSGSSGEPSNNVEKVTFKNSARGCEPYDINEIEFLNLSFTHSLLLKFVYF